MISNPCRETGDLEPAIRNKIKAFLRALETAIEGEASRQRVPHKFLPALAPCNVLVAVTKRHFHVVFSNVIGKSCFQMWADWSHLRLPVPSEQYHVVQYALLSLAFIDARALDESIEVLDLSAEDTAVLILVEAKRYVKFCIEEYSRPRCIPGHELFQPLVDIFFKENPFFNQNVFVAMRLGDRKQGDDIELALRVALAKYGLIALRAKKRMYDVSGDPWMNACVYMIGCKYAVCVFEEGEKGELNPDIAMQAGFLGALNRPVLLLKEQELPVVTNDMFRAQYRKFDRDNISATVPVQIGLWAERELGLRLTQAKK